MYPRELVHEQQFYGTQKLNNQYRMRPQQSLLVNCSYARILRFDHTVAI